MFNELNQHL